MYSQDDIQYALESTEVLLEPDRRIDTFGSTSFEFHLISELMDSVNETRVREGVLHADRPTIIKPEAYSDLEFEHPYCFYNYRKTYIRNQIHSFHLSLHGIFDRVHF